MSDATKTQPQASPADKAAQPPSPVTSLVKDGGPKIDTSRLPPPQDAAVTQPVNSATDYFIIPLERIELSKTNPRKNFQGPEFDELVASIKQHGVIVPILVRPRGLRIQDAPGRDRFRSYQIVAGERRYRAALKALLPSLPAIVRELSDEQALELQLIENLQREDVTALEEAEGYNRLINVMLEGSKKYPRPKAVAELAARVGKSVRYIYARMRLVELAPAAQEAIKTGRLEVSHGDELVKLPAKQQEKLVEDILSKPGAAPSVRELKKAVKLYSPARPVQAAPSEANRANEACRSVGRKMRQDVDLRGEIMVGLHDLKFDDNSPFVDHLKGYLKGLDLDRGIVLAYLRKAAIATSEKKRKISAALKAAKPQPNKAKPARATIKQGMKKLLKKAAKKAGRK
jgi:ParB/RepB/Spo0J family partition protein